MATPDLTVMGAGIFGLAVAWEAARRGARVRVIERERIGAGASGGVVGALSPHVPEQWNAKKQFQLEALLMAERFWAGVHAASGCDPGYARTGRVQPLADPGAVDIARRRADEARRLWKGLAAWRVVPAAADGWTPASGSGFSVEDTLAARIAPRRALKALAGAIQAKGGEIVIGEGEAAGAVVWATGVAGLEALGVREAGVKGQAAVLGFEAAERPQVFADGLHIVPHADGTVAVGSTSERVWDDREGTDGRLDALVEKARAVCPALAGAEVVERWAGLRPRWPTRGPVMGEWPGRPGHYVANGGFKIGFGVAPKVAEVLADLVLEGKDRVPEGMRTG